MHTPSRIQVFLLNQLANDGPADKETAEGTIHRPSVGADLFDEAAYNKPVADHSMSETWRWRWRCTLRWQEFSRTDRTAAATTCGHGSRVVVANLLKIRTKWESRIQNAKLDTRVRRPRDNYLTFKKVFF
eukprot:m.140189 g.140189  ORF g.140189 m.140189 type:complete len:130 (-) comp14032_c0_seq2:247-636(-)